MKYGDKVKYYGPDGNNITQEWIGTIIGTGKLGVTVEFDNNFHGHSGVAFNGYNDQQNISTSHSAWWFDYQPDPSYAYTHLVSLLKVIKTMK